MTTTPAPVTTAPDEPTTIDTGGVAVLVRATLRHAFPRTRWSVRVRSSEPGTLIVRWSDGPRVTHVEALVGRYRGRHHDPLTQTCEDLAPQLVTLPGETMPTLVRYDCARLIYSRYIGPAGYAAVAARFNAAAPGITHVLPDGTGLAPGWIDAPTATLLRVDPGPVDIQCAAHRLHARLDLAGD